MQICLKVKKSKVIDICLYNYLIRPESITCQKEEKKDILRFDMVKSMFFLLDTYDYIQPIREEIYLKFYPFFYIV